MKSNAETVIKVIWDEFIFEKDQIAINPSREGKILPKIPFKGVFASANNIKKEIFSKGGSDKAFFKLCFSAHYFLPQKSPSWPKLKSLIDTYLATKSNAVKIPKKIKANESFYSSELSTNDFYTENKSLLLRNKYIKLLATIHSKDFPILLIQEFINNHKEDTFLFRTRINNNRSFVFWENASKNRATHVFFINDKEINCIELIKFFIASTEQTVKRALLYQSNDESIEFKKKLNYYKTIKHTSSFEITINALI